MEKKAKRKYNCKDISLIVACNHVISDLRINLVHFIEYSPLYNSQYMAAFEAKTEVMNELVLPPRSEQIHIKIIHNRIRTTMGSLTNPNQRLSHFVELAFPTTGISVTDFGITELRKALHSKNVGSTLKCLRTVCQNNTTYQEALSAKGLNAQLSNRYTNAYASITADKKKTYEIDTNRKKIIDDNIGKFNDLYDQLCEILTGGKALFGETDPEKAKFYSFRKLMKQNRRSRKKASNEPSEYTETYSSPKA